MAEALITKYRPRAFEDVVGHELQLKSLMDAFASDSYPHCVLISGPAGLGKTTLARLLGDMLGAAIQEVNVAANNGIDDAKELVEMSQYSPVHTTKSLLWILDECHTFSKQAWQTMLKLFEEPPAHLFIVLCTTDVAKVPTAIQQRCFPVKLAALPMRDIETIVETVAMLEEWTLADDVRMGIIQAAEGSPRRALSLLQAGHGCTNVLELSEVVTNVDVESNPVYELTLFLVRGGRDWSRIKSFVANIKDEDEALSQMGRILSGMLARTDKEGEAKNVWSILDALTFPRATFDKRVQLIASIGAILWE